MSKSNISSVRRLCQQVGVQYDSNIELLARIIIKECIDAAINDQPEYEIRTDAAGWGKAGRQLAAKMIERRFQ